MGRWYCPPRVDVTVLCNQEKLLLAPASHQGSSVSSLLLKRHHRGADSECPSLSNIHTVHNLDVHNCTSTFLNLQHLSQVWIFLLFLPQLSFIGHLLGMDAVLISQLSLIQPFEEGTTIVIESKMPLIGCTAVWLCVIFNMVSIVWCTPTSTSEILKSENCIIGSTEYSTLILQVRELGIMGVLYPSSCNQILRENLNLDNLTPKPTL